MQGISRGLIKVLCRHFRGRSEKKCRNPQSGWSESRPTFEPSTSRIKIRSVTACVSLLRRYIEIGHNRCCCCMFTLTFEYTFIAFFSGHSISTLFRTFPMPITTRYIALLLLQLDLIYEYTPWYNVFFEQLIIIQMVTKLSTFQDIRRPCLLNLTLGPHHRPLSHHIGAPF
jgi:hypothetical protein